jgi:predicted nucleic acid-binding Zn ribbon protein
MSRPGGFPRFRKVGSVLPTVLKHLKLDRTMATQPVVTLWPEIAGAKIAEHARALTVEDRTLVLLVDGQAWMTQLKYLKPQLVKKIGERAGRGVVTDIRLVLGRKPASD